jgi:dTDP-4-amino-4,6-dideoxygalactose transaminase
MDDRTIPFLDLPRLHASIRDELDAAYDRVVRAGSFIEGAELAGFERAFAAAHRVPASAGVGSGTDALALALRALGIGPGHEVVVPAMTFVATAEAVVHAGATPVLADVDADTLLLTPETVEPVLTSRTRAVIPVHLFGHVVPPTDIAAWIDRGLLVLEDAAQAHLGHHGGVGVGHMGHAAAFSFYPGKNLGALGDGGAVISRNPALPVEVQRLRNHGCTTKYEHEVIGWCSRLDGLQAALLQVKLAHLATWTDARRRLADRYGRRFAADGVRTVPWQEGDVHHLLVVRIAGGARDGARDALAANGVQTGIHYPIALSEQPSMRPHHRPCPNAEQAGRELLSLPMDPLMTDAEVDRVCDEVATLVTA